MIIFLYGSDTYRLKQKLRNILENLKETSFEGVDFRYFNFSKNQAANNLLSFKNFQEEIKNISLFGQKRIILLNNFFDLPNYKGEFLERIEKLLGEKDILIFVQEGEIPEGNELFRFLKEKARVEEFRELKGLKLKNWLKKEFIKYKTIIKNEALEELINYTEGDMWRLSNEIKKLVNYKAGQEITLEDVRSQIQPGVELDIFKTVDAIAQKDKREALKLLHLHLGEGDSPRYLFSMITFQFRNILIIRDLIERGEPFSKILRETSLHPLVIKKSYSQAWRFSLKELKKIYQKLFQLDFQIKIGKIEPETALELFISQL